MEHGGAVPCDCAFRVGAELPNVEFECRPHILEGAIKHPQSSYPYEHLKLLVVRKGYV